MLNLNALRTKHRGIIGQYVTIGCSVVGIVFGDHHYEVVNNSFYRKFTAF